MHPRECASRGQSRPHRQSQDTPLSPSTDLFGTRKGRSLCRGKSLYEYLKGGVPMSELRPPIRLWQIVPEIVRYLLELLLGLGSRPSHCPHCGMAGPQKWGRYLRRPKCGSGTWLFIIPIQRYRCGRGCCTFSVLPSFLCRYLHYFSYVVTSTHEEFAAEPDIDLFCLPCEMDGPSFLTVRRWTTLLAKNNVQDWIKCKADRLTIPCPPGSEPLPPKELLELGAAIARAAQDPIVASGLLQWGKLRFGVRYSPENQSYSNHPLYA